MPLRSSGSALLAIFVLTGCAAALVPVTSDPYQKLEWADALVKVASRPLPAERLIGEAMNIFSERDDPLGLAAGHYVYGRLLVSKAVGGWRKWYIQYGFEDKTATYENRFLKAIEYFQKAEATYARYRRSDWLTVVDFDIGQTHEYVGDRALACRAFEQSEANYRATTRFDPQIKLPADFAQKLASRKQSACQ